MRKFFLLIAIVCCFLVSRSQNQDDNGNLIYPSTFSLSTPLNNGKISFFEDKVSVAGSLGFTVIDMYKPYVEEIRTHIAVFGGFDPQTGEPYLVWSTGGPTFTRSDFTVDGHVYNHSDTKDFSVEIPFSHDFESGDRLAVFYKYYFNKAVNLPNFELSGWAPLVTHGKEWFVSNTKQYAFVKVYPSTSFSGPDDICDEGIYTITNPYAISLENADGIATLTSLGNNQWKVERINNAVGTVVLKSLVGSNAYEKNIRIGNQAPTSITGNSFSLDWSRSYTFTVNTVDANSTLEIVKEGAPNVTFTRLDNNRFTLSTPPKPNSNDPITPVYVLNIKARVIDPECGNSEYIHQEIRVGSTIPFE